MSKRKQKPLNKTIANIKAGFFTKPGNLKHREISRCFIILFLSLFLVFVISQHSFASEYDTHKAKDLYKKAVRLIGYKDYHLAEDLLIKSIEKDSRFAPSYIELGFVLYNLNRFGEAERNLETALKYNDRYDRAYYVLSLIQFKLHRLEAAEDSIKKAIEISPVNSKYHQLLGSILAKQGKHKTALASFEKAVELDPGNYSALARLALCNFNLGNLKKASEESDKALAGDPNGFDPLLVRGIMLARSAKEESAYQYFEKAARASSEEPLPYYNMALIEIKRGERGKAEYHLLKSIELDRYNASPFRALGRLYRDERRFEDALRLLEKAKRLNPDNPEIYLELGTLALKMNNPADASAALEKGVLLAPDNALLRNALGSTYRVRGKYQEALQEFHRAVALDPNLVVVYFNLGNLFEERGMIPEAIENLEKYVEMNPGGKDIDAIKRRIETLKETRKMKGL